MKKWINGFIFILCILIGFYFIKQPRSKVVISTINLEQKEIKTEIDSLPKIVDIGTINPDSMVFRKVFMTNIEKSPLVVTHIDSGCGCVKVEYDKKPVPPDSIFIIDLQIKPTSMGYFSKKVFVFCNVPKNPLAFIVKGWVGISDNRPKEIKNDNKNSL